MVENIAVNRTTYTGIGRRTFLKNVALLGTGVILGGVGLNELEKSAVENGIETESATFVPIYETHYEGIDLSKVPDDLDILFKEMVDYSLDTRPSDVYNAGAKFYFNKKEDFRSIKDVEVEKMARNGMELMLGDVWAEPELDLNIAKGDFELLAGFGVGLTIAEGGLEFLAGLGVSLALLRDSLKGNITRKKFLKVTAAIGALWLMAPGAYALSRGGPQIGKVNTERDNALNRIIDKVYGIQSDLHPEMLEEGTFRNLIMANKMLAVAEDFKKRNNRKAKIGFNVEYGHNGIEEFLRVGHSVCRWIIEKYPKAALKFVAEKNGGPESLWTARLFKLPKDLPLDIHPDRTDTDWNKVEERKVVDFKLRKALAPKFD